MIAHLGVVTKFPRGSDVFFRFVEIAFREMYPAQRVPVGDQR